MYYTIENCMFTDPEKKYADIDELFSFLTQMGDVDWEIEHTFEEYLDAILKPVVLFDESICGSSALHKLLPRKYRDMYREWYANTLSSLRFVMEDMTQKPSHEFFQYTIHVYDGDIPPIKVYCKDTREDVDSVYLHGIYDSTEEAQEAVRELNDFAILNLLHERYFIAEKSFHPSLAQINVQL